MALVKCRVLPGGNYGRSVPGTILEVEAEELARVPWALVSLDDEAKAAAQAKAAEAEAEARQAEHEKGREMYRAQFEQAKQAAALRAEQEAAETTKLARELRGEEGPKPELKEPAPKGKGK